jgi:MFS family permease
MLHSINNPYNEVPEAITNSSIQTEAQRGGFDSKRMLVVFMIINLLTYLDRGTIGVCLDTFETVFSLSNLEGGMLGGAYMLGFIVASPIFAHLVTLYKPFHVMAGGLIVWCLAAGGTGLAMDFSSLLIARTITGVGEASFVSIAPPFIDALAPSHKKSSWLSLFYCAIPVGYAAGAMASGLWLEGGVGGGEGWRFIYFTEALVMVPFLLYCVTVKPPTVSFQATEVAVRESADPIPSAALALEPVEIPRVNGCSEFMKRVAKLMKNPLYVYVVLGYSAQTFTTGAIAYYGVEYVEKNLGMSVAMASGAVGGMTVFVGIFGTAFGGWFLDRLRGQAPSTRAGLKILTVFTLLSLPFLYLSFALYNQGLFFATLLIAEFLLFSTFSPANSVIIWSVPFEDAPLALALSVVVMHILGDVISTAAVGEILDATNEDWRFAMMCAVTWLIWAAVFWGLGWRAATKREFEEKRRATDDLEVLTWNRSSLEQPLVDEVIIDQS